MPRFELQDVKQAANGQWARILNQVAGIDDDYLDGNHGPCPRCGGNKRWRFTDFQGDGGAFCNDCAGGLGDGFNVIRWFCDVNLPAAIVRVGELLGVQEQSGPLKRRSPPPKPNPVDRSSEKQSIDNRTKSEIEPVSSPQLLKTFLVKHKRGVTQKAIEKIGAFTARYKGRHNVIAIPEFGEQTGFVLYHMHTKNPHFYVRNKKTGQLEKIKIKSTHKGFAKLGA